MKPSADPRWYHRAWLLMCLCRLHRPTDLLLLLLGGLSASLLAGDGSPHGLALLRLLLAVTLVRCAAWVLNDWLESRLSPTAGESFIAHRLVDHASARYLFAALLGLALLLVLPLGLPLLYLALAVPLLLAGLWWIRTRLYLTQLWLGICFAWLVPLAYAAQGQWPDKGGWLFTLGMALWAMAFTTLYAWPRTAYEQRLGIHSLAQLFGEQSWRFVLLVQALAIVALWLAGNVLGLGWAYTLGLMLALLLLLWQIWLIVAVPVRGILRSYRSQVVTGIAILAGIVFDYL